MKEVQFEGLLKGLELDPIQNWETNDMMWFLFNSISWRAPYLYLQGFEEGDKAGLEFNQDGVIDMLGFSDDIESQNEEILNWARVGKWLKEIVFGKMDLGIVKTVGWNYGDEGGPGFAIVLTDGETWNQKIDDGLGTNFGKEIAFGLKPEGKLYYICLIAM